MSGDVMGGVGTSRRKFLGGVASVGLARTPAVFGSVPAGKTAVGGLDVLRQPDGVRVQGDGAEMMPMERNGARWVTGDMELTVTPGARQADISLVAERTPVRRIHLRWTGAMSEGVAVLSDAWERSYGDLAWEPMRPERVLPWYCLVHTGERTDGFGVRTGAGAFAFWQVDAEGVSLWLDVRNGGVGVRPGQRVLQLASVVTYSSRKGETAFEAARQLCRAMAPERPLVRVRGGQSVASIYGSNDWYYAYGRNTAEGLLRDAELMGELAPTNGPRPYTVVDDGYQDRRRFPDMAKLAAGIQQRGVKPGVWVRPLRAPAGTSATVLLPAERWGGRDNRKDTMAYDPTNPEGRAAAIAVVREAAGWGFDLIKHDFTTYELLGAWGNEMGASPTRGDWHFYDRTRTNAEILTGLYQDLRGAAGDDRVVIGCNTVGHLSAGIFDGQRTGDDVSGHVWERTRRMGVNTLGFRLVQNGVFFATDADCVPITRAVPWELTREWLRAVAESGSVLLVSPEREAMGKEQKDAVREAFAMCVSSGPESVPQDWLVSRTPEHWTGRGERSFRWTGASGADPFEV